MKGTENFKTVILQHCKQFAASNDLFNRSFNNPEKSIDDCITYILNRVKESGQNGFEDAEIFGMAIHYYDEAVIDIGGKIKDVRVVSNHHVELSAEEIAEMKQKAKDDLFKAEQERLTRNKPKPAQVVKSVVKSADVLPNDRPQLSLF